jgi:branched-chain amino acid transport system ATP-binding protein
MERAAGPDLGRHAGSPAPAGAGAGLRAIDVGRSYAGIVALRSVSIEVHRHEVVGLIGPNGAGKSTLVNILTGFDRPDEGRVELDGAAITGWSPLRRCRSGLARTFQHGHSFAGLTVRENIEVSALGAGLRPVAARARAALLLALLGLESAAGSIAAVLPHGQERRLGVARALASTPRYVLLDEPAAGLNEGEVPEFADVIRSVRSEHDAGVLLIDHNVSLIMGVCDRIYVLDHGQVIALGEPAQIAADPAVATAYLGTVHA